MMLPEPTDEQLDAADKKWRLVRTGAVVGVALNLCGASLGWVRPLFSRDVNGWTATVGGVPAAIPTLLVVFAAAFLLFRSSARWVTAPLWLAVLGAVRQIALLYTSGDLSVGPCLVLAGAVAVLVSSRMRPVPKASWNSRMFGV